MVLVEENTCEGEPELALGPHADMIPVEAEKTHLRSQYGSNRLAARLGLSSPQSPSRGERGPTRSALLPYPTAETMVSVQRSWYMASH